MRKLNVYWLFQQKIIEKLLIVKIKIAKNDLALGKKQ